MFLLQQPPDQGCTRGLSPTPLQSLGTAPALGVPQHRDPITARLLCWGVSVPPSLSQQRGWAEATSHCMGLGTLGPLGVPHSSGAACGRPTPAPSTQHPRVPCTGEQLLRARAPLQGAGLPQGHSTQPGATSWAGKLRQEPALAKHRPHPCSCSPGGMSRGRARVPAPPRQPWQGAGQWQQPLAPQDTRSWSFPDLTRKPEVMCTNLG